MVVNLGKIYLFFPAWIDFFCCFLALISRIFLRRIHFGNIGFAALFPGLDNLFHFFERDLLVFPVYCILAWISKDFSDKNA